MLLDQQILKHATFCHQSKEVVVASKENMKPHLQTRLAFRRHEHRNKERINCIFIRVEGKSSSPRSTCLGGTNLITFKTGPTDPAGYQILYK